MTPIKKQLQALKDSFKNATFIDPGQAAEYEGSRLQDFLITGKCRWKTTACKTTKGPFRTGVFLIVVDGDGIICLINAHGQLFITNEGVGESDIYDQTYVDGLDTRGQSLMACPVPDAQLIPSLYQGKTFDCIINGDEEINLGNRKLDMQTAYNETYQLNVDGEASLSFTTLGRFLNGYGCAGTKALLNGRAIIIDWSADEWRKTTKTVERQIKKEMCRIVKVETNYTSPQAAASKLGIKPPEPGFYLVSPRRWHRSGCMVIQMTIGKRKASYLFGVDEDSYFGCELPEAVDSVKAAYKVLVPSALRRKAAERQGEWFFESVKRVPKVMQCVAYATNEQPHEWKVGKTRDIIEYCSISMPKDTEDSNTHTVLCKEWRLVHKNGQYIIYALDPTMKQHQHEDVHVNGWIRFHKNTAVRSFSVAGVD